MGPNTIRSILILIEEEKGTEGERKGGKNIRQ
jgi:hypothetical protein